MGRCPLRGGARSPAATGGPTPAGRRRVHPAGVLGLDDVDRTSHAVSERLLLSGVDRASP